MANKHINIARKDILKSGHTEIDIREELADAQELWDQISQLRIQMNEAKRKAADEAAKPFLEKIKELEDEYSLILKLGGI